jgi:hypothetical protein
MKRRKDVREMSEIIKQALTNKSARNDASLIKAANKGVTGTASVWA